MHRSRSSPSPSPRFAKEVAMRSWRPQMYKAGAGTDNKFDVRTSRDEEQPSNVTRSGDCACGYPTEVLLHGAWRCMGCGALVEEVL